MIISESDCPFTLFQNWYQHAEAAEINDPNAANLCTVDHRGRPSSRIILVKQVDKDGFSFFTNYNSAKACACRFGSRGWSGKQRPPYPMPILQHGPEKAKWGRMRLCSRRFCRIGMF